MAETIAAIKEKFEAADIQNWEELQQEYSSDARQGVQKLL